jgi:2,4-didehydro-3-deoxy-L-rhamnonate hydrolase
MIFANVSGRASIIIDDRVLDIESASGRQFSSDPMIMSDLAHHDALRGLAESADAESLGLLDPSSLGAPVPRPGKGFGVGLNYRTHAEESGRDLPTEPHLFGKSENVVCGPYDTITLPTGRDHIDYECELVIVFGRVAKGVSADDAWSYLAGVTAGQDLSDRAEQFRPPIKQFTIAKSYDQFGPIGPFMMTPDELPDPNALSIETRLNGTVMQSSNTSDLIFSVPQLVQWLTRFMTFKPGDMVWTGTPGGVGEARTPPVFLRNGDVLETALGGVGLMRNRILQ